MVFQLISHVRSISLPTSPSICHSRSHTSTVVALELALNGEMPYLSAFSIREPGLYVDSEIMGLLITILLGLILYCFPPRHLILLPGFSLSKRCGITTATRGVI